MVVGMVAQMQRPAGLTPPKIQISLMHAWSILGVRDSGKTTFARELLRAYRRAYADVPIYILDTKQSGDFRGWRGATWSDTAPSPITHGMQIWQPLEDNQREYNQWLANIFYHRKPAIVFIDELSALTGEKENPNNFPRMYRVMLKQGRALGMCVFSLTQEAAYLPKQTLGQMTHFVRFRVQDEYDARKADSLLGRIRRADGAGDGGGEPVDEHGFFYARMDKQPRQFHYYQSYRDFFGVAA
jgi:hypothetical protein